MHLLAYFLRQAPSEEFRTWLNDLLEGRRDRNRRLIASLQAQGIDIDLPEVERMGRTLTGRPHFARILIDKGYCKRLRGSLSPLPGRNSAHLRGAIRALCRGCDPARAQSRRFAGTRASHPARAPGCRRRREIHWRTAGCRVARNRSVSFRSPAGRHGALWRDRPKLDLLVTGGSDFHGANKPQISLGTGHGNLNIPKSVLNDLRARA